MINKFLPQATNQELIAYSEEMQVCQTTEQEIIESATAKIANNREALQYATQMCAAFTAEYEDATAQRTEERNNIRQLKEFVVEQAEIFGDYGIQQGAVSGEY